MRYITGLKFNKPNYKSKLQIKMENEINGLKKNIVWRHSRSKLGAKDKGVRYNDMTPVLESLGLVEMKAKDKAGWVLVLFLSLIVFCLIKFIWTQ